MTSKIIEAGIAVAQRDGIAAVTARSVAKQSGISRQTVHNHYISASAMRDDVFRECIRRSILPVIAQLIATKHPIVSEISNELRARAIQSLT